MSKSTDRLAGEEGSAQIEEESEDLILGRGRDRSSCLISYQRAQRLIERGCEVFLTIVVVTPKQSALKLAQIPVVSEFVGIPR